MSMIQLSNHLQRWLQDTVDLFVDLAGTKSNKTGREP